MPDRSGWDVLRDLRRRQLQIPTIVLSAVRVSQNRLDEFQPMAYLPKPFPIEALLRLVVGQVATPAVRQPRW
jgi:DNA-binding response OmpR family regulator